MLEWKRISIHRVGEENIGRVKPTGVRRTMPIGPSEGNPCGVALRLDRRFQDFLEELSKPVTAPADARCRPCRHSDATGSARALGALGRRPP